MDPQSDVPATWGTQLAHAERSLAGRSGSAARDEALRLLASLLREPMTHVLAQPATPMSQREVERYSVWVARRMAGEALPHITGRLIFMGLELTVGPNGPLVAPAAQWLVEVTLECARTHAAGELSAAEIGAGCGAIALALAAFEPRFVRVFAVDSSPDALQLAATNGMRYQLNLVVDWREGDGLGAVPEPVDMIICDSSAATGRAARLFAEAATKLRPGGMLLCALADEEQREAREALARALPHARVWAASSSGAFVVVARIP